MNRVVFYLACISLMLAIHARAWAAHQVGEILTANGDVAFRPAETTAWLPAARGMRLHAGDAVRTGPASYAAVLCVDESQLKLGENTLMIFNNAIPSRRLGYTPIANSQGSSYAIKRGQAWLRNSQETFRFEMTTPAVTAAIRGTEFVVHVDDHGASAISLLNGRLSIFNALGSLNLNAGEVALAEPGQAPRKQLLLQPEDAVQWVIYHPGVALVHSQVLSDLSTAQLTPAVHAYDRGDWSEAELRAVNDHAHGLNSAQNQAVLGFLALRAGAVDQAADLFTASLHEHVTSLALAGQALVLYRKGKTDQAYAAITSARNMTESAIGLWVLNGYVALLAGKADVAPHLARQALAMQPDHAAAHELLAHMALAANRKDDARRHAEQALANSAESPSTLLCAGLVDIAFFDLQRAEQRMQAAADKDPGLVEPLLYLTRLHLGAERIAAARATIQRAMFVAPEEASVWNMQGFVFLALREYAQAQAAFMQAARRDPNMGEPHLGLGLCAYAGGDEVQGLREILTATLLEPRVSQFQSMLGKALYQARSFAKALDILNYASALDPRDPTPHLYKGIILTDLNRPGEAIKAINTSIDRNDNRAVFRSSLMLDRDLAVRNADLARSYAFLGLHEWAFSKALTAVKYDPQNPSAHLFLSSAYAATRQRTAAAGSELILYRLLSPANQNTFASHFDYTPMFEAPYGRTYVSTTAGLWDNGNPITGINTEVYGGRPGLAVDTFGSLRLDKGLRDNNSRHQPTMLSGLLKWEPTVHDALFASATLYDTKSEDNYNLNDWTYQNSPLMKQDFRNRYAELGYVHRFTPEAVLMLYMRTEFQDWQFNDGKDEIWLLDGWPIRDIYGFERDTSISATNIQAQQQWVAGAHTYMLGLDVFRGSFRYDSVIRDTYWLWETLLDDYEIRNRYMNTQDSLSIYLADSWKLSSNLVLELGLSSERVSAPRYGYEDTIDRELIGARVGLNWQASDQDVLRLGAQRYLNTHLMSPNALQPSDVAGFPSWLNADDGSEVMEFGAAWERQWNLETYSVMRLNLHDVQSPQYDAGKGGEVRDVGVRRYQAYAAINRILTSSLGFWSSVAFKRLVPNDFAADFTPNMDFSETNAQLGLSYLHENGFGAYLGSVLVHQHFSADRARDLGGAPKKNETFALLHTGCSYLLPDKRGRVALDIHNLLNTHFSYEREFVALDSMYPSRQILFSLTLYF